MSSEKRKRASRKRLKVPWEKYEHHVSDVLKSNTDQVKIRVKGKRTLRVGGDEYEVDAYATCTIFSGAKIHVVVECKHHASPIKRDVVMTLHAKVQALRAHKGMLFSTSGFQRGAVSYAKAHGIALVELSPDTLRINYVAYLLVPSEDAPPRRRRAGPVACGVSGAEIPALTCVLRSPVHADGIEDGGSREFYAWLSSTSS